MDTYRREFSFEASNLRRFFTEGSSARYLTAVEESMRGEAVKNSRPPKKKPLLEGARHCGGDESIGLDETQELAHPDVRTIEAQDPQHAAASDPARVPEGPFQGRRQGRWQEQEQEQVAAADDCGGCEAVLPLQLQGRLQDEDVPLPARVQCSIAEWFLVRAET